jgi:hypothetical protein
MDTTILSEGVALNKAFGEFDIRIDPACHVRPFRYRNNSFRRSGNQDTRILTPGREPGICEVVVRPSQVRGRRVARVPSSSFLLTASIDERIPLLQYTATYRDEGHPLRGSDPGEVAAIPT